MKIIRISKKSSTKKDLKDSIKNFFSNKNKKNAESIVNKCQEFYDEFGFDEGTEKFEKKIVPVAEYLLKNKKFKNFCDIDGCFRNHLSEHLDLTKLLKF